VPRALAEVAARLQVVPPAGPPVQVTGMTLDSRAVQPGDLYAALPGARTHGAQFAADAAARGAVAVITDRAGRSTASACGLPVLVVDDPRARLGELAAWVYGEPAGGLVVVGVTGTNGKTTTAHLLDDVLRSAGRRTGLIGTVETRVGDSVLASVRTTPEAPEVQALLAVMRECGVQVCTMEVSSHALALGRVDGLVVDVAVFTNLSADHLDFHRDLADYFAVKASLFTPARSRRAVVCVDDPWGRRLAREASVPVTTVATASGAVADWRVGQRETTASGRGTQFTLIGPDGTELRLLSPLAGPFNVANCAVAAVVALVIGVPAGAVARGLAGAPGVPGRMERVPVAAADEPLAVVDYAHTPDAVATAVRAVRASVPGRVAVVLGAGGGRDPYKRSAMGRAAAQGADLVVVTDDNPRFEDPAGIRAAVLEGARRAAADSGAEVVEVADRRAAILRAVAGLGSGDAVLVAGKGHETGQEVAGVVHPFDDRAVLAEVLVAEASAREQA
jgi:UDP-N-acetylmuramoyl-L-alanyl-D-glutamate--2,6-diaminopimelate ligase